MAAVKRIVLVIGFASLGAWMLTACEQKPKAAAPQPQPVTKAPAPDPSPIPTEAEIEKALATVEPIKNRVLTKGPSAEIRDSFAEALAAYREAFPPVEATERFLQKNADYPNAETVREYLDRIDYCYPVEIRLNEIIIEHAAAFAWEDVPESQRGNRWALDAVRRIDKTLEELTALRGSVGDYLGEARTLYCTKGLMAQYTLLNNRIPEIREEIRPTFRTEYLEQMIQAEGGYVTTPRKLHNEFQANEIAALQKYKGRRIFLTGRVAAIDADIENEPAVRFRTSNQFMPLTVTGFPVEDAAAFRKGQDMSLICQNVGEIAGTVFCEVVPFQF